MNSPTSLSKTWSRKHAATSIATEGAADPGSHGAFFRGSADVIRVGTSRPLLAPGTSRSVYTDARRRRTMRWTFRRTRTPRLSPMVAGQNTPRSGTPNLASPSASFERPGRVARRQAYAGLTPCSGQPWTIRLRPRGGSEQPDRHWHSHWRMLAWHLCRRVSFVPGLGENAPVGVNPPDRAFLRSFPTLKRQRSSWTPEQGKPMVTCSTDQGFETNAVLER